MLNGIVKAAVIVGIAVMADQFFADGTYTDAALSMLRQIHSSRVGDRDHRCRALDASPPRSAPLASG
jgi:hypothetical protein